MESNSGKKAGEQKTEVAVGVIPNSETTETQMGKNLIEVGLGVVIEVRENDDSKIHNLKSNGDSICNLGVRLR